jgi:predicted glutamine amidotransferase
VNSQPFTHGRWLFTHNGCVVGLAALGPKPIMDGQTDSEEYFRRWCAQGQDISGYRKWVDTVASTCRHTSLTTFLSDGTSFLACRRSSGQFLDPIPAHIDPASLTCSYTLYHWTDGRSHIIASEKLESVAEDWRLLDNGEIVQLNL